MKRSILKKVLAAILAIALVIQPMNFKMGSVSTVKADYAVADSDVVIGTFYNYGERQVSNHSSLGLYCDWTNIDGGKPLDMTVNGLDKGAYLHITVELNAIKNGQHVEDFTLGGFYFKVRSIDDNGENNVGWSGITLKEGKNQLDIPLYSLAQSYAGTAYSNTTKTGNMDWTQLNRLIFVSLDARNYYGTDTEVSMTLSDVCITCPKDAREPGAYENVRIAEPSSDVGSEDLIAYSVNAVTDKGADNSGNTDSTAAIQSAINEVKGSGGVVFIPSGQYRIDGNLNIPGGVTLRGEWKNPNDGGLGKGTILKAYNGAGNENGTALIIIDSGACLRDISVWYPNQSATSPVAYPYTINGSGHTSVYNVTLYNSYNGFKNNSCSSMLIRGMYGTVLNNGIWGAYAYDVPRIEQVYFDTSYWAESGLSGAPSGGALNSLNAYCESNLTALIGGEQDWGYWYDINVNHAKYACYLTAVMDNYGAKVHPGNIAIGDLTTNNVEYGVYIHSISYPGLELTYSNIDANKAGIYYGPKPANSDYIGNEAGSVNASYYNNATVMITKTNFSGSGYAYQGMNDVGKYSAANFNNCTFESWSDAAIYLTEGNLVCSNGVFNQTGTAIKLGDNVVQGVLSGNTFASDNAVVYNSNTTSMDMTEDKLVPDTPDYEYDFAPSYNPATNNIFNVETYGALAGVTDSTAAFQAALNAAKSAGGGTVYVPAGSYALKGSLRVPEGVELRGSFDGAHYGNSTSNGSVLYVYANKDNENAEPFITLEKNAGVRGFTIIYPEQGITDDASIDEPVHKYPATVQLNKGSWVRTCTINGAYTMLDAMTNVCDNFVINDVTGCWLGYGLKLGHGTNGGYVQDFHSNYTSWPTNYLHAYKGNVDVTKYTTQNTTWMQLGDFSNIKFFSDFTILISTGMDLITDPYTGKCTQDMVTWGTAFDATGNGIIGKSGSNSKVTLLSSMGVYNQHDVSYNVVTEKGFNGTINLFNADVWSPQSRVVNVAGGTVNLVQYLSWCCYNGVCYEGGTVNMYGSTFVGSDTGSNIAIMYEAGAKGEVVGNNNNYGNFNIAVKPGATDVTIKNNGVTIDRTSDIAVEFNTYAPGTYTNNSGVVTTGWKALTPIKLSNGSTQNHAGLNGYNPEDLFMKVVFSLDKGNNAASDSQIFKSGTISLRQAWSPGDGSDDAICFNLNDGNFYVESGKELTLYMPMKDAIANNPSFNWSGVKFVNITLDTGSYTGISMNVSDIRIVDNSVIDYWKYELYQAIQAGPDVKYVDINIGKDYISQIDEAMSLYKNASASMEELVAMIDKVEKAATKYSDSYETIRDGWTATASLNNGAAGNTLDNNLSTRWATNTYQVPGQWFMVDFGEDYSFNTLILDVATSTNDGPAGYEVYVSDDGVNWGTAINTKSTADGVININTKNKRYVKIEQTGNKNLYWSIHEFYAVEANLSAEELPEEDVVEPPIEDTPVDSNLLLHGRTYYENDELKLAWTNSGCTFNFNGTGATATITTSTTYELIKGYLNVYVDGDLVPTKTISLDQNSATYVLAEGLAEGQHTITLRKRNEAAYGGNATIGISNISITGGDFLTAPKASNRKIEIIGDSITSGFTNLIEDGAGNYSTATLEGTMTYASLTGKAFDADTSILSRSGIRFVRTDSGESMIDYYPQVSGLTGNTNAWNFGSGSDVVVINLGTNDYGATNGGVRVTEEYTQSEATELLKLVRAKNPNAIIIWAYGIMGDGRSNLIQAAISSLNDAKMYYLPLAVRDEATEGIAVGGHPTITTGINRSFDLVEFIAEKTGWDYNYDSQLATQLWLLRGYDNETLKQYTHESASNFVAVRKEAEALPENSSAVALKTAIEDLQAARNALVLATNGDGYNPDEEPTTENQLSDLIITEIYTDETYYAGEEAQFYAKIKNVGNGATPSDIKHGLALSVDGSVVAWCDTHFDSMEPGEEVILKMNYGPYNKETWTVTEGTHTVSAVIDDHNLIAESDENNNSFSVSMAFTAKVEEPTSYSVKLDGTEVATVEEGETYTFPRTAKVGYYGDGKLYKKGSTYTVTKDIEFYSVGIAAGTGASIKWTEPSGMRFNASLTCSDTGFYDTSVRKTGMLIAPYDFYSEDGNLDFTSEYIYLNVENSGWTGKTGTFGGALASISPNNYKRMYIARAYVTVEYADGSEDTVYSNMSGVRSVGGVAQTMKDTASVYNNLSTAQKALLETYLSTVN